MLEHYKKTFASIQSVILLVTAGVLVVSHSLQAALVFFATMQIGSITGAMWARRLKHKLVAHPLRSSRP
jgi:membrane protein DedA with SNARE-associated domain